MRHGTRSQGWELMGGDLQSDGLAHLPGVRRLMSADGPLISPPEGRLDSLARASAGAPVICLIAFGVSPMTEGAGNRPVLVPRMPMAPARIPGAEAAWVLRGVTALTRPSASSTEPPLAFVLRSGVGGEGEGDTTSGGSPTVVVMPPAALPPDLAQPAPLSSQSRFVAQCNET